MVAHVIQRRASVKSLFQSFGRVQGLQRARRDLSLAPLELRASSGIFAGRSMRVLKFFEPYKAKANTHWVHSRIVRPLHTNVFSLLLGLESYI
jgi:hypothetical protein